MLVVDGSWYMPNVPLYGRARRLHSEQRIPGSVFCDIDDLRDANSRFPHMLPSPEVLWAPNHSSSAHPSTLLGALRYKGDVAVPHDSENTDLLQLIIRRPSRHICVASAHALMTQLSCTIKSVYSRRRASGG